MAMTETLVNGGMYEIYYRLDSQRLTRVTTMKFLSEDADHYYFSLRPIAGTQRLPKRSVLSIRRVPITTPPSADRTLRKDPLT